MEEKPKNPPLFSVKTPLQKPIRDFFYSLAISFDILYLVIVIPKNNYILWFFIIPTTSLPGKELTI